MKIAVLHFNPSTHPHHERPLVAMATGLLKSGFKVAFAGFDQPADKSDLVVVWGWRQPRVINAARSLGVPILVMEHGHIQPRSSYYSCGFNGLAGLGKYPLIDDGLMRFNRYIKPLLRPWRRRSGNLVVVCGQVPGDAALYGCDIREWVMQRIEECHQLGFKVIYRPHPLVGCSNDIPTFVSISRAPLELDLSRADYFVTYTSTVGVESVLAGVPTVAWHQGSMVSDIAMRSVKENFMFPDRMDWANRLAYAQWTETEVTSGEAWNALRGLIHL